jgi:hypothetical protein
MKGYELMSNMSADVTNQCPMIPTIFLRNKHTQDTNIQLDIASMLPFLYMTCDIPWTTLYCNFPLDICVCISYCKYVSYNAYCRCVMCYPSCISVFFPIRSVQKGIEKKKLDMNNNAQGRRR